MTSLLMVSCDTPEDREQAVSTTIEQSLREAGYTNIEVSPSTCVVQQPDETKTSTFHGNDGRFGFLLEVVAKTRNPLERCDPEYADLWSVERLNYDGTYRVICDCASERGAQLIKTTIETLEI